MATKVDPESSPQIRKAANLTSLFQARLAETPKKPMPPVEPQTAPAQSEKIERKDEN
ncbi:MAG: hypothetical protein V4487_08250 [Chlamydiota bacterium]